MTTGRNVQELLRLVAALQTADAHHVSTPEGWRPGDDVILAPLLTTEAAYADHEHGADWYFRTGPLPDSGRRKQ